MAPPTTDDARAEQIRFEELGPQGNAASRAMLHMCKIRSDNVNRMEDYWNAMLASYFPLEEGFMISRSSLQGFRTLAVVVAAKDETSLVRVLLYVSFSHNDGEEPPVSAQCAKDFHQGYGVDGIVCMTMGATTYKPILMIPPNSPGGDCVRRPLTIRRRNGERVEFGGRFYRVDSEGDRKKLDKIFRILHREGLRETPEEDGEEDEEGDAEDDAEDDEDDLEGDEEEEGDALNVTVDPSTGLRTESFPRYAE
ncbi:hypothetical protein FKW77_005047 [Venturia effusa]|uniref:Uncharacterized protein n=1 Tax=Venturia effusa TaxID=50376 RepID=A0A517LIP2_9PEZI|nr:hypothetical protein FKW77_005047 [Venturia effusa]